MEKKEKISRFTIDIPFDNHKQLKALAAIHGKSMRELVLQSIESQIKMLEGKAKKIFSNKNINSL